MKIAVLGTLDSKGHEHAFVADAIRQRGHQPVLIDVGVGGDPQVAPDIPRTAILATLDRPGDRGACVTAMAAAVPEFVARLAAEGAIEGIISLGGGGGTSIGTAAMRALPLGFPKVMVSTLASGNVAHYLGTKDIVMVPSIVDVAGLNRVSRAVFTRAAAAVCAMAEAGAAPPPGPERPLIVASMFGNTTDCINTARADLEAEGYEVLVFHATGAGGRTMEDLIATGLPTAVLDLTTTEIADEVVGGTLSAGPDRLGANSDAGLPCVVAPGCVDMVNFGARDTVPAEFAGRQFYIHNDQITLMRTTPDENVRIAEFIATKLNSYPILPSVLLPLRGLSVISAPGGPFHHPEADAALFQTLRAKLNPAIPVREIDATINDPAFAHACSAALLASLPA
ncbi:Tm-1-like ATP-binding domain-containing protein [soil metagenome]